MGRPCHSRYHSAAAGANRVAAHATHPAPAPRAAIDCTMAAAVRAKLDRGAAVFAADCKIGLGCFPQVVESYPGIAERRIQAQA